MTTDQQCRSRDALAERAMGLSGDDKEAAMGLLWCAWQKMREEAWEQAERDEPDLVAFATEAAYEWASDRDVKDVLMTTIPSDFREQYEELREYEAEETKEAIASLDQ